MIVICLSRVPFRNQLLTASALIAVFCSVAFRVPETLNLAKILWIYPFVVLGYAVVPLRARIVEHRYAAAAMFCASITSYSVKRLISSSTFHCAATL